MRELIKKAIDPFKLFFNDSRSTGILLLFCSLLSITLSNTFDGSWYRSFWTTTVHYPGNIKLPHSALAWINDLLMAIFFFFAGMEIKRELLDGELSGFKKAILPFGAALGGMIVPALIYISINDGSGLTHGWGIPTATDIAFSLAVASLLGKRVPASLKIFLMALAIIDDLGAIVVIAIFYGNEIQWLNLFFALFVCSLLWLLNYRKIKPGIFHIALSLVLWYLIFNSGIEASITGVLVAFMMPVNSLPKLENGIHKTVNFIILPLFVLANTAIIIPTNIEAFSSPVSLGVVMGLVIGKPVGIFLFSKIMIKLKIARLPLNTNLKQLIGVGSLAGIGFTMSIFTTTLAFTGELNRDVAKISILASLILSIVISSIYFKVLDVYKPVAPAIKKTRRISANGIVAS
jgi:NhaA family Na+:H+ antiporter